MKMIYENFKDVVALCEQIQKHEDLQAAYSNEYIDIKITYGSTVFQTIGAYESCEHPNKKIAMAFKEKLQEDLRIRINNLKRELERL